MANARSLRPGLSKTKPRRDAASDAAAALVREVAGARQWTSRDIGIALELTPSSWAKFLLGRDAHFAIRDILLLPKRDALELNRAIERAILDSPLLDLADTGTGGRHGR